MRTMIARTRNWLHFGLLSLRKSVDGFVDNCHVDGRFEIDLIHADGPHEGEVYRSIKGRNVVTSWLSAGGAAPTSGRDMVRRILVPASFSGSLAGSSDATILTCKLGSGTVAELASDTDLASEIGGTAKTLSTVTFDAVNPYVTFEWVYAAEDANTTISEIGIYSGRGDFFARKTFPTFTNSADFALRVRYKLKV